MNALLNHPASSDKLANSQDNYIGDILMTMSAFLCLSCCVVQFVRLFLGMVSQMVEI